MKSTATEIVLVAWYKNCPANDVIRTNSKRDISLNLSNNIQHTKSNKNIICWNRSPHKIWGVNSEKNIINNSRQLANWICKHRPSCDPGLNPENINCAIFHYVVKVKQIENKRMRLQLLLLLLVQSFLTRADGCKNNKLISSSSSSTTTATMSKRV